MLWCVVGECVVPHVLWCVVGECVVPHVLWCVVGECVVPHVLWCVVGECVLSLKSRLSVWPQSFELTLMHHGDVTGYIKSVILLFTYF